MCVNSDKSATRSGLVGGNLTVLDLKTSCRALSASMRWTRTICRRLHAAQPIRKCHESHMSGIGAISILNDPAPSLNAVSRDKKSASVRQADNLINVNPIWPRQKICSSTTKNRLVCGSLYQIDLELLITAALSLTLNSLDWSLNPLTCFDLLVILVTASENTSPWQVWIPSWSNKNQYGNMHTELLCSNRLTYKIIHFRDSTSNLITDN